MISLSQIRTYYQQAADNEQAAKKMLTLIEKIPGEKKGIWLGYLGAAKMLAAKYAFFPHTKIAMFQAAKSDLDNAIAQSPQDVELRFIRLGIQYATPTLLGYKTDMEKDKAFILQSLSLIEDEELLLAIRTLWKRNGWKE